MLNVIRDRARFRGDLQVEIHRADGSFLRRYVVKNLISYNGLNSPLYLWAQDGITVTDYQIAQLATGTGGVPPTRGDIGLNAPLGGGPTGGIILLAAPNRTPSPATGELVITASLDINHANGFTLLEAGLILGNAQLFARQVHPAIPKTALITVSYTWRIAVTS